MKTNINKTIRSSICLILSVTIIWSASLVFIIDDYTVNEAFNTYDVFHPDKPVAPLVRSMTRLGIQIWYLSIASTMILLLWKFIGLPEEFTWRKNNGEKESKKVKKGKTF